MSLYSSFTQLASNIAAKNITMRTQMVAILVKGGNPIAFSSNSIRYKRGTSLFKRSVHAEAALIADYAHQLNGGKLLLYRFNRNDKIRIPKTSAPCKYCAHVLAATKLSQIIFKEKDGSIASVRPYNFNVLSCNPSFLTTIKEDDRSKRYKNTRRDS